MGTYHPDGLGFRVALLHKNFKIHVTQHVRHVDDRFPCITSPPKTGLNSSNRRALKFDVLGSSEFLDVLLDEPDDVDALRIRLTRGGLPRRSQPGLEVRTTRTRPP